ncbi:MAG: EutN/CcmL family microcompartment protein [Bacteroidota bacterium]
MKLGVVVGKVVSTKKCGNLTGHPIRAVHYLRKDLSPSNVFTAAVDTVGANDGDVVMICLSSSARKTDQTKDVATDSSIIGIVDSVTSGNKDIYNK